MKVISKTAYKLIVSLLLFSAGMYGTVFSQPVDMVRVDGGDYIPFYSFEGDTVSVETFYMSRYPVTNEEFLVFVTENPDWRRSNVKRVFADDGYLDRWAGDLDLGPDGDKIKNSPVTQVSWFAARAYAKWKGARLPTLDEWEYAASASRDKPVAGRDPEFVQAIMDWYSSANPPWLPPVGDQAPNYYGIHDLHGLVWEWVLDFNTIFISGESRADQGELKQYYCAAGSSTATDIEKENYAAFLRFGLRSSLEADFSINSLGFRIVADNP